MMLGRLIEAPLSDESFGEQAVTSRIENATAIATAREEWGRCLISNKGSFESSWIARGESEEIANLDLDPH